MATTQHHREVCMLRKEVHAHCVREDLLVSAKSNISTCLSCMVFCCIMFESLADHGFLLDCAQYEHIDIAIST